MELISKLLEGKEEDFPNPILFWDTCGLNKEYFLMIEHVYSHTQRTGLN